MVLLESTEGPLRILALNRPERRNALAAMVGFGIAALVDKREPRFVDR